LQNRKIQQTEIWILPLGCLKHGYMGCLVQGGAMVHGGARGMPAEIVVADRWLESGLAAVEQIGATPGPWGIRRKMVFFFLND